MPWYRGVDVEGSRHGWRRRLEQTGAACAPLRSREITHRETRRSSAVSSFVGGLLSTSCRIRRTPTHGLCRRNCGICWCRPKTEPLWSEPVRPGRKKHQTDTLTGPSTVEGPCPHGIRIGATRRGSSCGCARTFVRALAAVATLRRNTVCRQRYQRQSASPPGRRCRAAQASGGVRATHRARATAAATTAFVPLELLASAQRPTSASGGAAMSISGDVADAHLEPGAGWRQAWIVATVRGADPASQLVLRNQALPV